MPSSGDLEKSLRADIESYVSNRMSGFKEEVARLRAQLDEALARLHETADAPVSEGEAPLVVALSEHLRNARNLGIEAAAAESTRARASSDMALVKAAVDELESRQTQADILNSLVNRSAAFAPRVAFFVVKNERATGWRARGLEGTVGDDAVRELSMSLDADTVLGEVVRARATWAGEPGSHAEDHTIYNHFGGEPPQRLVAVPMIAREKVVAVLYADSAGQDADAVNLEALETLARVAGMSVELLALRRSSPQGAGAAAQPQAAPQEAQPREVQPTGFEPHAAEPSGVEPREVRPTGFEPREAEEPQPEAHEEQRPTEPEPQPPVERQPSDEPQPAVFGFEPQPIAAEAQQSSHSLLGESQVAAQEHSHAPQPEESFSSTFAPAVEGTPAGEVSPLGRSRRYGSMDMDFPVEVAEEDKRYHNEARRFARLLVSEIKLYNEQKVREGRDNSDLYDRLREDIDRSRQMYDKRVRPEVSSRYDYFHHELVNMLAEGDAARLGAGYPGATA
ncbi:MAG TPA: GAF domain-containing protein [Pyrinomonadaceae bacterium]|nr:GAF domain-containing protein [Pyrinomonadaceae bacterium]